MDAARTYQIQTFTAAGFGENAYLVACPGSASAVAVDPGGKADEMADAIEAAGLELAAILLTHAHLDHVEGVAKLKGRIPAPIYMHPADRPLYDRVGQQAAAFGMRVDTLPPVDHTLEHGQTLELGGCRFEVRHAPGHSPGHVVLYAEEAGIALVGDVVFLGSIGRTDLPGGDYQTLMNAIRDQVLSLPDSTALYPGHGPATTVRHERLTNPFLVPQFGGGSWA